MFLQFVSDNLIRISRLPDVNKNTPTVASRIGQAVQTIHIPTIHCSGDFLQEHQSITVEMLVVEFSAASTDIVVSVEANMWGSNLPSGLLELIGQEIDCA